MHSILNIYALNVVYLKLAGKKWETSGDDGG